MSNLKPVPSAGLTGLSNQALEEYCYAEKFSTHPVIAELLRRLNSDGQHNDFETKLNEAREFHWYSADIRELVERAQTSLMVYENESNLQKFKELALEIFSELPNEVTLYEEYDPRYPGDDEKPKTQRTRSTTTTSNSRPRVKKPGRKEKYRHSILMALHSSEAPLNSADIVKVVSSQFHSRVSNAIYVPLRKAETDGLIKKDGQDQYRLTQEGLNFINS